MRIRWTFPAAADLERIADYLRQENPAIERDVLEDIIGSVDKLRQFPNLARPGEKPGTRELVIQHLPYIVVYRVRAESIEILNVWHASQDWQ